MTVEAEHALTPNQEAILLTALMSPRRGLFVEVVEGESREALDRTSFAEAWRAVMQAHPALRSQIAWQGRPKAAQQRVSGAELELRFEDLSHLEGDELTAALARLGEEERLRDFTLAQAPLTRVLAIELGPRRFAFVWSFHHILLDGGGIEVVLRDVFRVYDALVGGGDPALPAMPSAADHAAWLSAHHRRTRAASEAWWRSFFEGLPPTPAFPGTSSPEDGDALVCCGLELTAAETERLRVLAAGSGATLATVVQASWGLCLAALTGAHDLVFAHVRSCRRGGMERAPDVVGLLMSTLPLRVKLDGHSSIQALLAGLRAQSIAMRPHQHTALLDLQRWSGLPSGAPLFTSSVVFNGPSFTRRLAALGGRWVECERRVIERGDPGTAVTLDADEHPELRLNLSHGLAVLSRASARSFMDTLHTVLTRIHACGALAPREFIEALTTTTKG